MATCLPMIILLSAVALNAQNPVQNVLIGDTKVTVVDSYQGTRELPKPIQIVVYDFNVPEGVITMDPSRAAHLRGPLARRSGEAAPDTSPEAVAANVQAAFSKTLVSELNKTSIPTISAPAFGADAPVNNLTVRGDFMNVDQGDKAKRVMIGFGRGASDVQGHVIVSLVMDEGLLTLSEFNLNSESGKKPGAAATMGAGAAASTATSAGTDSKATVESDTTRMAKTVAKQIENIMAARQWIAPAQPH